MPRRSGAWRALRAVLVVLVVLGTVLLALVVALQTPRGLRFVERQLETRVTAAMNGGSLEIGRLYGNPFTGLTAVGVELRQGDEPVVYVDSAEVRYSLWSLLDREVRLRRVDLNTPRLVVRQDTSRAWNLAALFTDPDAPPPDTTARGWTVRIDALSITDGTATVFPLRPTPDSVLYARGLDARARDLVFGGEAGARLHLDTLRTRIDYPSRSAPLDLALGATLDDGSFEVDALRLDSETSYVRADGVLYWRPEAMHESNFVLQLRPLDFADLAPFVPALEPERRVEGEVVLRGLGDSLTVFTKLESDDGALFDLDGLFTALDSPAPTYRAEGRVRGFDPASFFGEAAGRGRINADLDVALSGPAVDRLDGSADLTFFDTVWEGESVRRGRLETRFDAGEMAFDFEAGLFGGGVAAEGALAPFAEPLVYDVDARLQGVALERVLAFVLDEPPETTGVLNGVIAVEGRGTDPLSANLRAEARMRDTRINQTTFRRGAVDLALADGLLEADAQLVLDQTSTVGPSTAEVNLRGEADLRDETIRYTVRDGAFRGLDLAALTGNEALAGNLNGRLSLTGRGTDPATLAFDARIDLDESRLSTLDIASADIEARFDQGRLRAEGTAAADGGQFAFEATAEPLLDRPTFRAEGTMQGVDLSRLRDLDTPSTDLNGRFAVSGSGSSTEDLTLDLDLRLDPSRYNEQQVRGGTVGATLENGTLVYEADLDFPEGGVRLAGSGRPFDEAVQFRVDEAAFDRLDLGAWLDNPRLGTDLNGRLLAFESQGTDPATMTLSAVLELQPSRINREPVRDGLLRIDLADGLVRIDTEVRLDQGALLLAAEGRFFDEVPTYEVLGQLVRADLPALLGLDSLESRVNLTLSVAGTGLDPATMVLEGVVTGGSSEIDEVVVDTLLADFSVSRGAVFVDTLLVDANVLDARGGGLIPIPRYAADYTSDFTFEAEVEQLSPLRRLVGAGIFEGEGSVSGRVQGGPERLTFEVRPNIDYVIYNVNRLSGLDGSVRGEIDSTLTLETDLRLGFIATPAVSIQQSEIEVLYADDVLVFRTDVQADRRRAFYVAGRADLKGEDDVVTLDSATVRLDRDRWELLQETEIVIGDSLLQVGNLLLFSESQQVSLGGVLDLKGDQTLFIATVEDLRAGAVTDLLGYPGLDGLTEIYLTLTGPRDDLELEGSVRLRDITSGGAPVGAMDMEVAYADYQLGVEARFIQTDDNTLVAQGVIPTDLRFTGFQAAPADTPVRFTVRADTFDIGWIEPFIDPELVSAISGELTVAAEVTGTQGSPDLDGALRLERGAIRLPVTNLAYHDIEAVASLDGPVMTISRAMLRSDPSKRIEGTLVADGTLRFRTLTEQEYDLNVVATNFKAIHDATYRGVISGTFHYGGWTRAPELTGDIVLSPLDVFLTEELVADELEPVTLTPRDVQLLEERFGYRISSDDTTTFNFSDALRMDLDVRMGRDVWLRSDRSPKMDIEFEGTLDYIKEPYQDARAFGTIEVNPRRSYIRQYGKRFAITDGELRFNGPIEEMLIDLDAEYKVPARRGDEGPTIRLAITGRLNELEAALTSEEVGGRQLDATEILSYIATGQPPGEGLFGGTGAMLESAIETQAASLAFGQLSTLVDDVAGEELGLDVIEIESDGVQGVTLTVGKYITLTIGDYVLPTLYATVRQPISLRDATENANASSGSEVSVEFEVFRQILMRLGSRDRAFRFSLLFEYAY